MSMQDLAMFGYRHAAGEFEADGYLSPETYRLLHTDQGEEAALGWFQRQWHGHRVLSHTGSNGYWYAMLAIQPEKRLAIAVASNVDPEGGAEVAVHELMSALMRAAILGECLMAAPEPQNANNQASPLNTHDLLQRVHDLDKVALVGHH
jgi:CubicO group peptidase (beta-lactamase class C family)